MSDVLLPYLPYDPTETMTSFVRRLSRLHTGQGAERFLSDLGIELTAIRNGKAPAVNTFAKIAGVDPESLMSGTLSRINRYRTFRGQDWTRNFVKPEGARICPECLLEDTEVAGVTNQKLRIAWRLRPMHTCCLHQRRLAEVEGLENDSDMASPFYDKGMLQEMLANAPKQEPTSLEAWVFDIISGREARGGLWLDGQTVEQGVRVCEVLGAVLTLGKYVNIAGISSEQWRQSGVAGFDICRQGQDSVIAALTQIRGTATSQAGQAGPKAMYGRLFDWIAYREPLVEFGPIKELLREHILDHTAIEPGSILLGDEVLERRCHSVYSLSLAAKMHPKRLRKLLESRGDIPPDSSDVALNLLVFPAVETEAFCKEFVNAVPQNKLPIEIGGTRNQVTNLYREGVIHAVMDRTDATGIGRIDFPRREIDRILGEIERLPVCKSLPDLLDLSSAAKRLVATTGQVYRGIRSGELLAFRVSGEVGLGKIRIRPRDLNDFKASRIDLVES